MHRFVEKWEQGEEGSEREEREREKDMKGRRGERLTFTLFSYPIGAAEPLCQSSRPSDLTGTCE